VLQKSWLLLVLPPMPMKSPVSLTHVLTLSTSCFASPEPPFELPLLVPFMPIGLPADAKLLPSPVAYSDPIDGSTSSLADKETKSAKGISQTHRPKKEATSVNVACSSSQSSYADLRYPGFLKFVRGRGAEK
jgi:hypothetical protein